MDCYDWISCRWHHRECIGSCEKYENRKACDKCYSARTAIRKQKLPNLFSNLPDDMEDIPSKEQLTSFFQSSTNKANNLYFPTIEKYILVLRLIECQSIEYTFHNEQYTARICENCNILPVVEKKCYVQEKKNIAVSHAK